MSDSIYLRSQAERKLATGQWRESRETYERLIATGQGTSVDYFNLGYILRCERRYAEAVARYRQAVAMGIERPEEALLNMAAIHSEMLNDPVNAMACLDDAVAVNPRFIPALLNRGLLFEDSGQVGDARSAYDAALQVAPDCGRALARQAILDIFEGNAAKRLREIQAQLDKSGTSLKDAIDLSFAEGQILDSLGDYDAAFDAFVRANEYVEEEASDLPPYDAVKQERFVTSIKRIAANLPAGMGNTRTPAPIFICGMFRSGSTLLESLLARHSQISAGGELEAIPSIVAQQLLSYPESLEHLDQREVAALRDQYLSEYAVVSKPGKWTTDKRPDNFLHIGLIKMLFPNAKILHTVRNSLDNVISIYFGNFDNSIRYGTDLENAMHWYGQYQELMALWKSRYGDDIHDVGYEDMVRDTNATLAAALEFCGLEWEEACAKAGKVTATVKSLSNWQVRQPVHVRSSGRWRNYERHLGERLSLPD